MKKRLLTLALISPLVFGGMALAVKHDEEPKVTLCHRTDSVINPYVKITVDQSAVDGQGNDDHSHHTGPVATSEAVAQALKDNKTKWGDIIPNVLNWSTAGQAVFNNDCKFVVETPPVTPPTTPPTTPPVTPPTSTQTTTTSSSSSNVNETQAATPENFVGK